MTTERIKELAAECDRLEKDVVYAIKNGSLEDEEEPRRKLYEFYDRIGLDDLEKVVMYEAEKIKEEIKARQGN